MMTSGAHTYNIIFEDEKKNEGKNISIIFKINQLTMMMMITTDDDDEILKWDEIRSFLGLFKTMRSYILLLNYL